MQKFYYKTRDGKHFRRLRDAKTNALTLSDPVMVAQYHSISGKSQAYYYGAKGSREWSRIAMYTEREQSYIAIINPKRLREDVVCPYGEMRHLIKDGRSFYLSARGTEWLPFNADGGFYQYPWRDEVEAPKFFTLKSLAERKAKKQCENWQGDVYGASFTPSAVEFFALMEV